MAEPIAETIIAKLSVHLGPNVARMAIKSFAGKVGVAGHEQLTAADVPGLIENVQIALLAIDDQAGRVSELALVPESVGSFPKWELRGEHRLRAASHLPCLRRFSSASSGSFSRSLNAGSKAQS